MSKSHRSDPLAATDGRVYLGGIQALVRLLVVQRLRDEQAGLKTGGFVSGYRGSPLGGLDEALWRAKDLLEARDVRFVPGVNEELAATAVWGSQQVALVGPTAYDGVFGLWYGKGPGVDRCGDVFKHMNFSGTARHGGVLLVAGDDHGAYSSTLPHQSDHLFAASMVPVLYPCNVQEYLELGLHGFAMSRFSGCAVAFKALADTVESSASIPADPHALQIVTPADVTLPPGGLNARLWSGTLGAQARAQEALMQHHKIYAAIAYARANRLNRVTVDSPQARLGIVASGKSYMDVLEALEELGIGLDEFMSRRRDEILAGELLRGRVDKRIIVSWRDVEREYARNVERFAAQSRTIVGRLVLRTTDAEKLTKAREAFAAGKPFAEVAKELGVKDDGAWRDFPVADIAATDLNDDLKSLLKDLPIGKASTEVTKGDSVTWYAIMARDSRPAASIYDPGVQLMLRAEIAGRRRMVEQSRYLKGLRDRWVAADIDQMRVRLQSIAVQRYVPGA